MKQVQYKIFKLLCLIMVSWRTLEGSCSSAVAFLPSLIIWPCKWSAYIIIILLHDIWRGSTDSIESDVTFIDSFCLICSIFNPWVVLKVSEKIRNITCQEVRHGYTKNLFVTYKELSFFRQEVSLLFSLEQLYVQQCCKESLFTSENSPVHEAQGPFMWVQLSSLKLPCKCNKNVNV